MKYLHPMGYKIGRFSFETYCENVQANNYDSFGFDLGYV